MKLTINTAVLNGVLSRIKRFANDKSTTNHAMRGVLLSARDNTLEAECFTQGAGALLRASCVASEDGEILVPVRVLADIVAKMPGDDVVLTTAGQILTVSGGGPSFEIRALSQISDFVRIPAVEGGDEMDGASFFGGIRTIMPAVAKDETRPSLNGVSIEQDGDTTRVVATDSYRLAVHSLEGGAGSLTGLLPGAGNALASIEKVVGGGTVKVVADDRYVTFVGDEGRARVRLVDAEFPNWKQLVPETSTTTVKIDGAELKAALGRAATIANGHLPVKIAIGEDSIVLSVSSSDVGNSTEGVEAEIEGDSGFEVGLSIAYLSDGLGVVGGETVTLQLNGALKPIVLRAADSATMYLLMPVRL